MRFGALGALSSVTSIAVYAALAPRAPLGWAWSGAYLSGLVLTTALSDRAVFSTRARPATRATAFVGYLSVFLIGMGVVWVLQVRLGAPPVLAGAASVTVSAPLNYALGRRLFLAGPPGSPAVHEELRHQS